MRFEDLVRSRHMVRSFTAEPIPQETITTICDLASKGPSAGNTAAISFLILTGDECAQYWDTTMNAQRRAEFPWPGLLNAPALVLICTDPDAYVRRYCEPDKTHTALGDSVDSWQVPYWFVDAGAALMTALLAIIPKGLGACFFGVFDHEQALKDAFGIPEAVRIVGTIAIGHPADDDRLSKSAKRPRRDNIHISRWGTGLP